jgi:hypothetical protein
MIRLVSGITLCMAAAGADPSAPTWFLVLSALLGLTLAAAGVRKLRR